MSPRLISYLDLHKQYIRTWRPGMPPFINHIIVVIPYEVYFSLFECEYIRERFLKNPSPYIYINSIVELFEVKKYIGYHHFLELLDVFKFNSLSSPLGVAFYPYEDSSYYG